MNFEAIESTTAKAVVPEAEKVQVADIRTKQPENEEGAAAQTDDEKAAALAETERVKLEGEKAIRKEEFLKTGKTEAEFEAEEALAGKTPEQIEEDKKAEALKIQTTETAKLKAETLADFLKSMGVESEEELRAKLNPRKPKTEAELAQEKEIYLADLAKFAVKKNILNNEEWVAFHNMGKLQDDELVFKEFAHNYKEANKGRKLDDKADPVTADEIQDKFNELYHIDSDNQALKTEGEKNMAIKAKSLREPLETKYKDATDIYDVERAKDHAVPDFKKFFGGTIKSSIPDKLEYGEGDEKVVYDLSGVNKDEIEQYFLKEIGNREFDDFFKGKGSPEQKARLEKEVMKELLFRHHKDAVKQALENGKSIGTKKASPGAETRFSEPAKQVAKKVSETVTAEDNAKIAEAMRRW